MPLDPQAQAVLDQMAALDMPDMTQFEPSVVRPLFRSMGPESPVEDVARVENRTVPGPAGPVPVRIYRPKPGTLPVLVFFHGGGFVIGDLDTHDGLCRGLANRAECLVVSVDYRLAPEARFPAAPEDCYAATRWVAENAAELGGDPDRIAIGGDSAGGNLTAVTALMARDRGGPALRKQVLVYPVTDCRFDTASYLANADGLFLTRDMMKWFWGHYLESESDGASPYASPLRADDLGSLPPALVVTAEYDPLCDEGEAYAHRLNDAGNKVTLIRYGGQIHGFLSMFELMDSGKDALDEICKRLKRAFA